jgi:hypothetical protein
MHYPHVKYYLINPILGRILLNFEPLNWNDDEKTLVRNEENWGVFTQLSNDLQFVKDGKDYIKEVFLTQGTEAELTLERVVAELISQGYELDHKGYLDLKTYSEQDEKVSIKFLTGGLQNLIESQFDEAYELERGTDINGNQITPLDFDTIYWEGRRIFLESLAEQPEEVNNFEIFNVQGNSQIAGYPAELLPTYQSEGLPINSVFQGQQINLTPYSATYQAQGVERPNAGGLVYINTTDQTQTFQANIDFKFFFSIQNAGGESTFNQIVQKYLLVVGLIKYELNSSDEFDFVERIGLTSSSNWYQQLSGIGDTGVISGESVFIEITVEPDQALAFTPYLFYNSGITPNVNDQITMNIFNWEFSLKFEQDSFFAPTEFKALKIWDAFNRNIEILTGQKNKFVSDFFKNGEFKDLLITSGKHIRNLPDAKISIELKDLYETDNYFNLGWAVETINNIEKFVVEPKSYFFQNRVVIDLGEVSELEISSKQDLLFKSMTFGNKKAGDYEEVQGLQEYNALTTFVSHLKTSDTKYEVEGKVRADLLPAELARRKNYSVAPNEDTRYDKENLLFNCKPYNTTKWTPKVWQDVLESEPVVYDPPTAGNLLLTPFRSMQRHSNIFNAGMKVYQDKFTRYSTGTGKVETQTQIEGEPVYAENSDIENNLLNTPIFEAIEYNFKKPLTLDIKKKLRGYTNVNGRDIPNVNFLLKFAYKGQSFTGYILEVSFNDPGEWKLIKSYN